MNCTYSKIVPIFNCKLYLNRCIDSILNQDYDNFEVILINDGSTDGSEIICEDYKKKDSRVIFISKENTGVSDSRNIGLKKARGKYILFLDSDDYIDQGYLNSINSIIASFPKVELINYGFYSEVDAQDNKTVSSDSIYYKEKYMQNIEEIRRSFVDMWDTHMLYNIWNKVYLKEIIDQYQIQFPKYNWGEDVEFNREYLLRISNMYNSSSAFYHYIRERNGAVTKKYKEDFFEIRKREFFEFNDYFEKWEISKEIYYEFSCRRFSERLLGCIENEFNSNDNFKKRYKKIKDMIKDPLTAETVKSMKPRSKKVKIAMFLVKNKWYFSTYIMGYIFNFIKSKSPSLFNKLKNRR